MKTKRYLLLVSLSLLLLQACSTDEHVNPSDGMAVFATVEVPDSEYTVKMFLEENKMLEVGYNHFYMGLYNSDDQWLENAHLSLLPMMTMHDTQMSHTVPYEEFELDHSAHQLQEYATVFVMPSMAGNWSFEMDIQELDAQFQGSAVLPITVMQPEQAKMISSATDLGDLFVSLLDAEDFEIGVNDLELTIHKRENGMSWPAMEHLTIEIETEMPAMGHGSPNNVNPVHKARGHYQGMVNFTMSGDWLIHFVIKDGEAILVQNSFEVKL